MSAKRLSLLFILALSGCDVPDLALPKQTAPAGSGPTEVSEPETPGAAAVGAIFGGAIDPAIFTGRANNLPLANQPFLSIVGEGFVEVVSQPATGLVSIGPLVPVTVERGKVYVVTAELERQSDPGDSIPTIEAFSLDENGLPFERNWAVKFFAQEDAPPGEKVVLTARFSVNPPEGSGIVKLAHPEQVRSARFTVSPNRGTLNGQISSVYSVRVEVK